ncbi:S-layer homology domain-containing protein [Lysinibacillus sp. S2017]|nr:S-layer homology domain-containing protein [Lysinibacillus sp. S2017]
MKITKRISVIVMIILITVASIPGKFDTNIGGILPVTAAANILSQDGIGYSGSIAGNEVVGTAFSGYQDWPSGFSKGVSAFAGGIFDGTSIWMIPYNADQLIKINPATGEMTGFSDWPVGFTKGSNAFAGGVYDGTNIWLIPYSANQIIKVNATTGVMTGFSDWPGGTKGSDQFIGGAFDGTNIWLTPYSGSRLIKIDSVTGAMTSYNSWPSGTILGSYPFYGSIFDGSSIWLIPNGTDRLIKVNPDTGDMIGFNNWPSEFTKSANAFFGGVFDGTNIWLIPNNATHVIKFDTTTGDMTGYNGWPSGFTMGSQSFAGGVYDGTNIWLVPSSASMLIKLNATTGEMTGFNNWPNGFTKGNSAFFGGVYDGENVWMIPFSADRVIKFGDSSSSDLSGLTLSSGTLSPAFNTTITSYTVSVDNEVANIDITPTLRDAQATVTVNGVVVTGGQSQAIPLNIGDNTVTIGITTNNSNTKTYTITVTRVAANTITTNTVNFDKYSSATGYQDIAVQLNLFGNTLQQIEINGNMLAANKYQINGLGDIVTLKKEYLETLNPGTHSFVFKFSAGNDVALTITVNDSTPPNNAITPNPTPSIPDVILPPTFDEVPASPSVPNTETIPEVASPPPIKEAPVIPTEPIAEIVEELINLSDIKTDYWAYEAIKSLISKGIILGYPNNEFRPNELISREHIILMISRLGLLTIKRDVSEFTDIPSDYLYYDEIRLAQLAGIIDGNDGIFNPKSPLTRAQAAKIIVLLFDFKIKGLESFDDVSKNAWYFPYVRTLATNNIVLGDNGHFYPNQPITRAQFATMLYRALQLFEKENNN